MNATDDGGISLGRLTTSPFVVGGMVQARSAFHGRRAEVAWLLERIHKHESTSIVGPRRIGKSSLAFHIYDICSTEQKPSWECAWLDGQSNHCATVDLFCTAVKNSTSIEYVSGSTVRDCLMSFEDAVISSTKHIVLIINEFEVLTSKPYRDQFNEPFFNTLRFLGEQGRCSLITTSHMSLQQVCKEILEVSSPFYNIFDELVMQHFTEDEAQEFLTCDHRGVRLSASEIRFISRDVQFYQHPLVLQIAADSVVIARQISSSKRRILENISQRVRHFLTHHEVQEGRRMTQRKTPGNDSQTLSKPVDLAVSILFPIIGVGLFMLEFALLMRYLTLPQAVLLALTSAITGFAIMVFAGRSIAIIGETTFFKLFASLITHIPLLSQVGSLAGGLAEDRDKAAATPAEQRPEP